jgi:ribosomal protein S18
LSILSNSGSNAYKDNLFGNSFSRGSNGSESNYFNDHIDKVKNDSESFKASGYDLRNRSRDMDDEDITHTLEDGMNDKLKKAASFFDIDWDEMSDDEFTFRPDVSFQSRNTYEPKDLDLRNTAVHQPHNFPEFETTTDEVLEKADFRNVMFLANFITESGIIKKRNQTNISAKAQRKIAREIKTARAFGLMPFTTMGTKRFVYGKTMEAEECDYEYFVNDDPVSAVDSIEDDPLVED